MTLCWKMTLLTLIARPSRVKCWLPRRLALRSFLQFSSSREAPVTSHLSMVPLLLAQTLRKGDVVVDATAGNGHDSLMLANIVIDSENCGHLFCFDVQERALEATKARLRSSFSEEQLNGCVHLLNQNHRDFSVIDKIVQKNRGSKLGVNAFVYNLGYLPGGDKTLISQVFLRFILLQK